MRIAVVEFAGKGGLIHYAYQLCRALAGAGADVTLLTDRRYELEGLPHAFRVEKLLDLWDPKPAGPPPGPFLRPLRRSVRAVLYCREWSKLVRYLRRTRPDIVQLGDVRFASDLPLLILLRRVGLRLADVCHNVLPFATGSGLPRRSPLVRSAFQRIYCQFDTIFVHYATNRRAFLSAFDVDPARVVEIPHGNEELFAELARPDLGADSLRHELGLTARDRIVLLFGTLSRYKGADLLLHAFPRVLDREPRARLVLAGFPAPDFDAAAHHDLARRLGIEDRVRFVTRYVESAAVAAWMSLTEVAVFPYRAVFQSGVLHVAHTFGVPIVATRVGATEDVIVDGESGLLVPPEDPTALAAAIVRILTDAGLAARLRARAREEARRRFAWERIATLMLERYRGLVGPGTDAAVGEGQPASAGSRRAGSLETP